MRWFARSTGPPWCRPRVFKSVMTVGWSPGRDQVAWRSMIPSLAWFRLVGDGPRIRAGELGITNPPSPRERSDRHPIVIGAVRGRDIRRLPLVGWRTKMWICRRSRSSSGRPAGRSAYVFAGRWMPLRCGTCGSPWPWSRTRLQLTVDLSSTQFIDIAGVRALAACAKRRRALGLELLVLAPSPAAEWILKAPPFARHLRWEPREHHSSGWPACSARNGRWMPHGSHREHQSSRLAPSLEVTDSLRRVRKRIAAGEHGRARLHHRRGR